VIERTIIAKNFLSGFRILRKSISGFRILRKTIFSDTYEIVVMISKFLFESLNKVGLVRRFDATLCLWVNLEQ
jgi:hypothetical protein